MVNRLKKLAFLQIIFFLLLVTTVQVKAGGSGLACESIQSGEWNQSSTWSNCNGSFPNDSNSSVLITAGHNIDLNLDFINIASLVMQAYSQITVVSSDTTLLVSIQVFSDHFDASLGKILLEDGLSIRTFASGKHIFLSELDGTHQVNLNASGEIYLKHDIGASIPLNSLNTDNSSSIMNISNSISINIQDGYSTLLSPTLLADNVSLVINYQGSGFVAFDESINYSGTGEHHLSINAPDAIMPTIRFLKDVTVGQLDVNGHVFLFDNTIEAIADANNSGSITFNDQLTLISTVNLKSNGVGSISVNAAINKSNSAGNTTLIVDSLNPIQLSPIGDLNPIDQLTASNTGDIVFNNDVITTGHQSYTGLVKLNNNIQISSTTDNADFMAGLDGNNFDVQLNFANDFNLPIAIMSNVNTLTMGPLGKTILTSKVNTPLNQIYNNPVELDQSSVFLTTDLLEINMGIELGNANGLFIDTSSAQSVIHGQVTGNGAAIFKSGTGTLTIFDDISITGPVRSEGGTLILNGTVNEDVTARTNGTLGGEGTINGILTADNGTISPGSSPGLLSAGNLIINSNSEYEIEIDGIVAGNDYDQIDITGTVDLAGNLLLTNTYSPQIGESFIIINNDDIDAINGQFNNLTEGSIINDIYQISYQGGDGNDVELTATCSHTINVLNNLDSGVGSLRQAVLDVCPDGMITFESQMTISLISEISIKKTLTIDGDGQTINGSNNSTSLFNIQVSGSLELNQINMLNAGIDNGGTIINAGTLHLYETYFANGLYPDGALGGGAITTIGTANTHIESSSFAQNDALRGGAIFNDTTAEMTIVNSTFYQNGPSLSLEGGSIHNRGMLSITNSTLVNSGSGSTTQGNTVFNFTNAELTFNNSIISAENTAIECINFGTLNGSQYAIDDGSCNAQYSGDLQLGEWVDNGGFANSIELLAASLMVNNGDDGLCPTLDQIGTPRPQGAQCDIGSMELIDDQEPAVVAVFSSSQQIDYCGQSMTALNELEVTFSEAMLHLTDESLYTVVSAGPNLSFGDADDVFISVDNAIVNGSNNMPTVTLSLNQTTPQGPIRIEFDSQLVDEFNNVIQEGYNPYIFRIDSGNFFNRGHFDDCQMNQAYGWIVINGQVLNSTSDVDNSNASNSFRKDFDAIESVSLSQCLNFNLNVPLIIEASFKTFSQAPPRSSNGSDSFELEMKCSLYDDSECMGNYMEDLSVVKESFNSNGQWVSFSEMLGNVVLNTSSGECSIIISSNQSTAYSVLLDKARLTLQDIIFVDGFD